jgi:hypothetical protein
MVATDGMKVEELYRLADAVTSAADGNGLSAQAPDVNWAAARIAMPGSRPEVPVPMPGRTYGRYVGTAPQFTTQQQSLRAIATDLGINEHAWASVGEAYLTQSIGTHLADGGLDLTDHAQAFHRVENPFGYHYGTVVLASEDGSSQVTLENYARHGITTRTLKAAVESNLTRFGSQLSAMLDQYRGELATAQEESKAAATAAVGVVEALISLRDARTRLASLGSQTDESVTDSPQAAPSEAGTAATAKAVENAQHLAEHRLLDLSALQGLTTPTKLWHMRLVSRVRHQTFHDLVAGLHEFNKPGIVVNPLTAVVIGAHKSAPERSRWIDFAPGAKAVLGTEAHRSLSLLARRVARVGLWSSRNGLPLPTVHISAGSNGPRLNMAFRDQLAQQQAQARLSTITETFRAELQSNLDAFQSAVGDGTRLDADRFVVSGHNRSRAFPEGLRPSREHPAEVLRRRAVLTVEMHPAGQRSTLPPADLSTSAPNAQESGMRADRTASPHTEATVRTLGPEQVPGTFAQVKEAHPEPIAGTSQWTMWGRNGETPQTSAYAVEFPGLDLRGVYAPPQPGGGLGSWQWHVGGAPDPIAITPFTLRAPAPSVSIGTSPSLPPHTTAPASQQEAVEEALNASTWTAGLRWRTDDEELYVFAPAGQASPQDAFAAGLQPLGETLIHVGAHADGRSADDSLWLTASRSIDWLRGQSTATGDAATAGQILEHYGWRYDIATPGGVDVNETLGLATPHPARSEVLFPGGVDGQHIRGAQRLHRGRPAGPYIANPGFRTLRQAGISTSAPASQDAESSAKGTAS